MPDRIATIKKKGELVATFSNLKTQWEYNMISQQWSTKTVNIYKVLTSLAATYLEIDEKAIIESINKYVKEDEEKKKKIVLTEKMGWMDVASTGEFKDPAVYIKALKRNQQLVYECDKKCIVL